MNAEKAISPYQFALFRVIFGVYLAFHCAQLIPYAAELFSSAGILPDPRVNFTYGLLPNPLEHFGSPYFATIFVAALTTAALAFMVGFHRRPCALLLWYGLTCLFNRNNLISNPSLPYIGMLLLLSAVIPTGEPLTVTHGSAGSRWFFPAWVFRAAWVLMAAGYTCSGVDKLLHSPSWTDGTALTHVLNLPFARPGHAGMVRDALLSLPEWMLALGTFTIVALESLALPLMLHRRTRPWIWLALALMHVGIVFVIDFADLSLGMLMLHLFTFDPEWFPARRRAGIATVFFDGACGLCDRTVQFLRAEDRAGVLKYAPLQGTELAELRRRFPHQEWGDGQSILYVWVDGPRVTVHRCSSAVLAILSDLGGFWRVVSWLKIVPEPIRDFVYDGVARRRLALSAACELT